MPNATQCRALLSAGSFQHSGRTSSQPTTSGSLQTPTTLIREGPALSPVAMGMSAGGVNTSVAPATPLNPGLAPHLGTRSAPAFEPWRWNSSPTGPVGGGDASKRLLLMVKVSPPVGVMIVWAGS